MKFESMLMQVELFFFHPSVLILHPFLLLTQLAIILIILFSIAGYLGRASQYFELASHFRFQYTLASFCCLLIFAGLQAWPWALGAAVCFLVNGAAVLPWYTSRKHAPHSHANSRRLRVVLANVLYENRRYELFKNLVNEEQPDILIAQEVTDEWLDEMKFLRETYPYFREVHQPHGSGIALFSRFPLLQCEVIALGLEERPGITARLQIDEAIITLLTFHPYAPVRRDHYRHRNLQLAEASRLIKTLPQPLIVIGDLNTTMWSPYFDQLLQARELVNTRRGFGLLPTWPLWLLLPFLMLPIDHCFVTPDIAIHNTRTGGRTGSDHLPLIVDLSIPETKQA